MRRLDRSGGVDDDTSRALVISDEEGHVIEVDRGFERLFGLTNADVQGKMVAELIIPPRFRAAYRARRREAVRDGASTPPRRTREFSGLRPDGGEFPVELSIAQTSEDPRRVTTWIKVPNDSQQAVAITRRRLALHERVEELVGVGSWECVPATGELFWSDNMFRLYGLEPGEITPSTEYVITHTHPRDKERVERVLDELMDTGRLGPLRYRHVLQDGTVRHMEYTMSLIAQAPGLPAHTLGALRDVTEDRWAEQEIAAHFAVSDALADWRPGRNGALRLLRDLAEALEFEAAALWVPREGQLIATEIWLASSLNVSGLDAALRDAALKKGAGLAGRAWATKRPLVVSSVAREPEHALCQLVIDAELHGGLAVPAIFGDDVLAVLGFASQDEVELTERLLRSLKGVGYEIGHFLARRHGELDAPLLTSREQEVLQVASAGHSGEEIAEQLQVSRSTIKTHFEHVYGKLGVHDRAAAVAEAMRRGLIG